MALLKINIDDRLWATGIQAVSNWMRAHRKKSPDFEGIFWPIRDLVPERVPRRYIRGEESNVTEQYDGWPSETTELTDHAAFNGSVYDEGMRLDEKLREDTK